MNTLVSSQKSPLYLAKTFPWKPMTTTILPTSIQILKNPSKTWKIHANAKGFTGRSASIEESSINRTSKKSNDRNSDDEELPQEVFNRIIVRILVSVGAPMALGIAFLHIFGVIMEEHIWDVPMWMPLLTSFLTFGASSVGIAYGALSTSLDPNEKGSFLGFEQVQHNWVEMWKEEDAKKK